MLYRKSGLKTHLHFSKGSSNPFWKCKSTAGSFIRQNQLMQIIVNSPSKDFVQRGEISHQGWRNQDITREWFSTAPISVASRASWLPPPLAAGARTHFLGACPEPHGWNIWDRNIETAENRICKRKRQELSAPGFNVWGGFEHLKYMSICTTVNFWTASIFKQEKGLAPVTPTHAAHGSIGRQSRPVFTEFHHFWVPFRTPSNTFVAIDRWRQNWGGGACAGAFLCNWTQ